MSRISLAHAFRRHPVLFPAGLAALLAISSIVVGNLMIRQSASSRVHDSLDDLPHRPAGLVLGCSHKLANGRTNLYFRYRVEAAAAVFHAGKVDYLIVSGDNHREGYDEPTDMRRALIAAGVPDDRIYRDYAGFRTLDSVVRVGKVFGQKDVTVISQRFHNERAIFIARKHGIDAIGFNAPDVAAIGGLRTRMREYLARFKTVLDIRMLNTGPKFLGPRVALGQTPPT